MAAIFEESDVPEQWKEYTAKTAERFKNGGTMPKAPTREKWEEAKQDPSSDAAKYYYYLAYPPKAQATRRSAPEQSETSLMPGRW